MKKSIVVLFAVLLAVACTNTSKDAKTEGAANEEVSQDVVAENFGEWQFLFDGSGSGGWRAYNGDSFPEGWIVEDSTLKSLGQGSDIGGDIIYAAEEFDEFELYLEWKISEGGNSGIFYHVIEDEKYDAPYYTAPEYQVIDQIGFPEKLEDWQSIGADYGMYTPDYDGVVKPAGEWNSSRIVFTKAKAEYWLNGKKTLEFVPWSKDWEKRKKEGKWKDYPDYGIATSGFVGLQDHGSLTWYRNIKIRRL